MIKVYFYLSCIIEARRTKQQSSLSPLEVGRGRMSNILSNGGQGSNALIVRLELGVVLEGMGVKIQDEVDSGKHSNVTSGQFASEVITLEQILEMGEMLGDLNLQSVLPSLSLIAGGILRLGQDVVKIVLLLNELLRPVLMLKTL